MKLDDALGALGRRMGVAGLAFNAEGVCRMVFDGRHVIDCERCGETGQQQAYLYSVIARQPAEGREALYQRLLAANLFGRETGDAVLALDAVAGEVLLQQKFDAEGLTEDAFATLVERFVDRVEHWSDALAQVAAPQDHPNGMDPGAAMLRV